MAIEKAFAIKATPHNIYAAIERDLESAGSHSGETFEVLHREPGQSIELRVTIGDVPCWLTYRLTPMSDYTEVSATLVPFGWRYTLFRFMTLGLRQQNFEIALVQGLVNLKEAVEDDEDADGIDGDDPSDGVAAP